MGSLDVKEAKKQFLLLVDKVNGVHLPSFAIWLDTKLAEYKVQGAIKDDDKEETEQQYPEWISRSLRQNLSFIFQGDQSTHPLRSASPVLERPKSVAKRKLDTQPEVPISSKSQRLSSGDFSDSFTIAREVDSSEAKEVEDIVIKLEESSDEEHNDQKVGNSEVMLNSSVSRREIGETPLPLVDQTFSLQPLGHESFNSSTTVLSLNDHINKYSTESNQAVTTQHAPVSVPATTFQHSVSELSSIAQHTVPAQPSLGSSTPVVLPSGSLHLGPSQLDGASGELRTCQELEEVTRESSTIESSPHWRKDDYGYSCVLCSSRSDTKWNIIRHVRQHTGERPFACPHCDYRCKQKSHLAVHVLGHTGETPYKCVYCSGSFRIERSLLMHLRRLHGDKPWPAPTKLR